VTQLQRVWQAITEHFEIAPEAELALEVHPGVTQRAQLAWLAEVGFHRISLGVQDLNPEVQQAINRFQTAEQTWQTLNDARELGFQSVNIDLVYGLPHQTAERFAHTLNEVVQMRPERLAVYSFAYIPGLFRTHERAIHATDLPSTADKLSLHLQAIRTFTSAGYEMIGMDHYAVPEDELALAAREHTLHRNFMGYTTLRGLSQLGVGVSAISDFGNGYFQNEKELTRYLEHWQQQQPVPVVHKALDKDDCLRREVIETLMCHGRLEFEPFETRYHVRFREYFAESLHALQPFVRDGLLQEEAAALQVKPLGQLFLRNLAAPFDRYLGQAAAHYSQTV
jgi:oxygen-independent coproporphyrinogen-3 oxidase